MRCFCLLLFFLCSLTYSQIISADTVSLDGRWDEGDLRSFMPIPFSVEQEGEILYISSYKKIEDVTVRIVSAMGEVYYEGIYTFLPSDGICLPLGGLPEGEYVVEFIHGDKYAFGQLSKK